MNSLEKVQAFMAELNGPPEETDGPMELAMRSAVMLGAPMIAAIMPEDPVTLDAYLEQVAYSVLGMRSDDAPPLQIVGDAVEGQALEEPTQIGPGE